MHVVAPCPTRHLKDTVGGGGGWHQSHCSRTLQFPGGRAEAVGSTVGFSGLRAVPLPLPPRILVLKAC